MQRSRPTSYILLNYQINDSSGTIKMSCLNTFTWNFIITPLLYILCCCDSGRCRCGGGHTASFVSPGRVPNRGRGGDRERGGGERNHMRNPALQRPRGYQRPFRNARGVVGGDDGFMRMGGGFGGGMMPPREPLGMGGGFGGGGRGGIPMGNFPLRGGIGGRPRGMGMRRGMVQPRKSLMCISLRDLD